MLGTIVGLVLLLVAFGLAFALFYGLASGLDAAKNYRQCLDELRNDPQNPELRQRALHLGRRAAVTNPKLFGEAKLMNDINAACARAGQEVIVKGVTVGLDKSELSVESRLEKLNNLNRTGLITDAEYQARRKEILREI